MCRESAINSDTESNEEGKPKLLGDPTTFPSNSDGEKTGGTGSSAKNETTTTSNQAQEGKGEKKMGTFDRGKIIMGEMVAEATMLYQEDIFVRHFLLFFLQKCYNICSFGNYNN